MEPSGAWACAAVRKAREVQLGARLLQGVDGYELAEPSNVLGGLDKEFWEGLAAKKWSERRDQLQRLRALASRPRLASGDYSDVLRELKKVCAAQLDRAVPMVACTSEGCRACLGFPAHRQLLHPWIRGPLNSLQV
jgi:hypothetical protein